MIPPPRQRKGAPAGAFPKTKSNSQNPLNTIHVAPAQRDPSAGMFPRFGHLVLDRRLEPAEIRTVTLAWSRRGWALSQTDGGGLCWAGPDDELLASAAERREAATYCPGMNKGPLVNLTLAHGPCRAAPATPGSAPPPAGRASRL